MPTTPTSQMQRDNGKALRYLDSDPDRAVHLALPYFKMLAEHHGWTYPNASGDTLETVTLVALHKARFNSPLSTQDEKRVSAEWLFKRDFALSIAPNARKP